MFTTIHTAIHHLLHDRGALPSEVEVSLGMPTREWVDSQLSPVFDLFLLDTHGERDFQCC